LQPKVNKFSAFAENLEHKNEQNAITGDRIYDIGERKIDSHASQFFLIKSKNKTE
jgi:hypothetical protein